MLDTEQAHTGQSSLRLDSSGPASTVVNSWKQIVIGVEPGSHVLSAFVRTRNVGDEAIVAACVQCRNVADELVAFATTAQLPGQLAGTRDWARISTQFEAPEGTTRFVVFAFLMGKGTVWYDDIELVRLPDEAEETR